MAWVALGERVARVRIQIRSIFLVIKDNDSLSPVPV